MRVISIFRVSDWAKTYVDEYPKNCRDAIMSVNFRYLHVIDHSLVL